MENKNPSKKVIIYDFDGVLVDTIPAAFENVKIGHPGITEEQYKSLFHKKPYMDGLETVAHLRIEETDEEYTKRRAKYSENKAKSSLFIGTLDTLTLLSKDYLLTINTNAIEENFTSIMKSQNLSRFFSYVAYREEKSSKAIRNQNILDHFGIPSTNAVYITDATGDVVEAHEAGIASIGVTWGVHDREYFEDVADMNLFVIVDTQAELIEKINNFFTK